jgi:hypothetical protein
VAWSRRRMRAGSGGGAASAGSRRGRPRSRARAAHRGCAHSPTTDSRGPTARSRPWSRGREAAVLRDSGRSTSGDQPLMPAQQRVRSHKPVPAQANGQQPGQSREKGPVRPLEPRLRIHTAKYRHLMPKDEDLGVQHGPRPSEQRKPCEDASEDQTRQSKRHGPRSSRSKPPGTPGRRARPRRRLGARTRGPTRPPRFTLPGVTQCAEADMPSSIEVEPLPRGMALSSGAPPTWLHRGRDANADTCHASRRNL